MFRLKVKIDSFKKDVFHISLILYFTFFQSFIESYDFLKCRLSVVKPVNWIAEFCSTTHAFWCATLSIQLQQSNLCHFMHTQSPSRKCFGRRYANSLLYHSQGHHLDCVIGCARKVAPVCEHNGYGLVCTICLKQYLIKNGWTRLSVSLKMKHASASSYNF